MISIETSNMSSGRGSSDAGGVPRSQFKSSNAPVKIYLKFQIDLRIDISQKDVLVLILKRGAEFAP